MKPFAAVPVCLVYLANPALAETWACTTPSAVEHHDPVLARYTVQGDRLAETTKLEKLGLNPDILSIVRNDRASLIAIRTGEFRGEDRHLDIETVTVVIDKETNEFLRSRSSTELPDWGGAVIHGTCLKKIGPGLAKVISRRMS